MQNVLASTKAVRRIASRSLLNKKDLSDTQNAHSSFTCLETMSDEQFEALAEARFNELRVDIVTDRAENAGEMLKHASKSQSGYFSVPKVVGE